MRSDVHRVRDAHLESLTVETDPGLLSLWLGTVDLPVEVVPGNRGVIAVDIATGTGDIRLEPAH